MIEIAAVFTMAEMNKEWNVNFQNNTLGIQHTYSTTFSIGQSISESPFNLV